MSTWNLEHDWPHGDADLGAYKDRNATMNKTMADLGAKPNDSDCECPSWGIVAATLGTLMGILGGPLALYIAGAKLATLL